MYVSIPQSGWRGFKLAVVSKPITFNPCFNPSVGMAGVQAVALQVATVDRFPVSIPQSGWRGFKPAILVCVVHHIPVSIPQSGWRGFKHESVEYGDVHQPVSIPQSGWRGFKLSIHRRSTPRILEFQSLSRDGGGSSVILTVAQLRKDSFNPSVGMAGVQALTSASRQVSLAVSIPQSGWRGFKRRL